ncbi:hypothetical protein GCM10028778_07950 [Barrientosiimonas marina]
MTNKEPISGGRIAETDDELKNRYELSLSASGSPTMNGIRSEVLGVEGVLTATVIENLSLDKQNGRPGRSFETYVLGGDDEDVARAIFKRRAAGVQAYGETMVDIEDDAGNIVPVGLTRAKKVNIHVEMVLKTNNEFPDDGKKRIITEIVRHIGGTDYDGNEYVGLQTGEDVYFMPLVNIIFQSVPGIENVPRLKIGKDINNTEEMNTIEISPTEVAITDYEKVDIS